MGKASNMWARRPVRPEDVLFLDHPRCIRPACRQVVSVLPELGLCAEHLLETYQAVSSKIRRAVVPGLPVSLDAVVIPLDPDIKPGEVVYYVDFGEYVKIGYTSDIDRRMVAFRNSHPSPQLLATEPGTRATEKQRHADFAEYHISREMYRHGPRLADHIRSIGGRVV